MRPRHPEALPCVEFVIDEPESARRHGFHTGQLVHYTLEPHHDGDGGETGRPQGPPEKLSLAFATADVVMVGWRLERLAEHLRDGDLLWVRSAPARYANLDRAKTYVTSITASPSPQSPRIEAVGPHGKHSSSK